MEQERGTLLKLLRHWGGMLVMGAGQVIRHRKYDYKGVIVGYDKECDAPESWIRQMGVDTLPLGRCPHPPLAAGPSARCCVGESMSSRSCVVGHC